MHLAQIRIAETLPCIVCGYELRTLRLSDRCPECGTPTADSLDHLSLAGIDELRRMRRGALRAGLAVAWLPALYTTIIALVLLSPARSGGDGLATVGALLLAGGPLIAWMGWAALLRRTRPIELPAGSVQPAQVSRTAPLAAIFSVAFAIGAVIVALILAASISSPSPPFSDSGALLVITIIGTIWAARTFWGLSEVRALARRASSHRVRKSARFWRWAVLAPLSLWLLAVAIHALPITREEWWSMKSEELTSRRDVIRTLSTVSSIGMIGALVLTVAVCAANFAMLIGLSVSIGRTMKVKARRIDGLAPFTLIPPPAEAPAPPEDPLP